MGLAEKLVNAEPTHFGLPCGVAEVLSTMPESDRAVFMEVMAVQANQPGRIPNRKIHEILLSEGYSISFSSISLHRRHVCRCFTGNGKLTKVEAKKS